MGRTENVKIWVGTNNLVFCISYMVSILFQNPQKMSFTCRKRGTLQAHYQLWSTVRLSVLNLTTQNERVPLFATCARAQQLCRIKLWQPSWVHSIWYSSRWHTQKYIFAHFDSYDVEGKNLYYIFTINTYECLISKHYSTKQTRLLPYWNPYELFEQRMFTFNL